MNQTSDLKIDCVVRVVTPENIEFEYLLAGPFQRLPAFLVDFGVRASVFIGIVLIGIFIGTPLAGGLGAIVTGVLGLLTFFVLSWLYGTLMEAHFNGRTIGKMLFGLRVISSDGRPINGSQAALRNLLRLSDLMPPLSLTLFHPDAPPADIVPTFFIGLLTMTLTPRMQRLGDLAASTMVVWDGRRGFNVNLQPEDARAYALAELIPPTFQISRTLAHTVALYMERRRFLSPLRRQEIANNLAQPLMPLFELRADTSSDLLLCAMYVRIYHSEQQRAAKLAAVRAVQSVQPLGPAARYAPGLHQPLFIPSRPASGPPSAGAAATANALPIIVAQAINPDGTPTISSSATGDAAWPGGGPWAGEKRSEP